MNTDAEVDAWFDDLDQPLKDACCQSAKVGQIGTREDYYYEEPQASCPEAVAHSCSWWRRGRRELPVAPRAR